MGINMKILIFFILFFTPIALFSQIHCIVEGIEYPISGTKIHTETNYDSTIYIESYMDITGDSIIYHEIRWGEKDTLTSIAEHYRRVSLSKIDAKKNKSVKLEEFQNGKVCLLIIEFKKNVLIHRSHFQGEKTSYRNKGKLFFEPLFDSKKEAEQMMTEYFLKQH